MNEYEILLSYLDKQDRPGFKKKKNDQVKSFEDISKETKKLSPVEVSNTKKIIEECQEEKNPIGTPQLPTISIGFDVEKFENMMRSRLIDDYKKLQSYERPYISVTELFYCLRKSYYNRLKYTTDLKKQFNFAYLDLINRVGNTIHDYVQEIYNFTETEKTVVTDKYRVKGRVDAIYDKFLYEFKTTWMKQSEFIKWMKTCCITLSSGETAYDFQWKPADNPNGAATISYSNSTGDKYKFKAIKK